jgi:hypothetical protein
MNLLPCSIGLLINSAAATAAEAQMQLRGSEAKAPNKERQLTSNVPQEPTHRNATGLKASTNNKYLISAGSSTGFIGFIEDFNRFNVSLKCKRLFNLFNTLYLTSGASSNERKLKSNTSLMW